MLWLKAFHIIAMVAWFSGLFYLPRLFVYHAESTDEISNERFKVMERRLYYGITTPSAIITIALGLIMLHQYAWTLYKSDMWLHIKLLLVVVLIGYHHGCGRLLKKFKEDKNKRSPTFYRIYNELPVFLLVPIVLLVVIKPF